MVIGHLSPGRAMIRRCFFISCLFLLCGYSAVGQYRMRLEVVTCPDKHREDTLYVAGDMNGWQPGSKAFAFQKDSATGKYIYDFPSLPGGIYAFKLTRGSWRTVETDAQGKHIENRVVTLSADTLIPVHIGGWADDFPERPPVSTRSKNVFIIDTAFSMPTLHRKRRVWIYLPEDYAYSRKRYPVIYMHDGQNLFDERTSAYGEWGLDEMMDTLPRRLQRIVVGIDHGGEKRLTEYNPFDSRFGKGEGDAYVEFVVTHLKPYIDAHYRTLPQSRYTAIAGSSMGGLISFYAALKYPKVFGAAGVFSPAFWIAPALSATIDSLALEAHNAYYFMAGEKESDSMIPDMKIVFHRMQQKHKARLRMTVVPEGRHNETLWRLQMPAFVQWLGTLK